VLPASWGRLPTPAAASGGTPAGKYATIADGTHVPGSNGPKQRIREVSD
jgi:hypothetical protein